eukprot:gnl/TRDRNA2_/TRDRNA2_80743_c1_seq1.p1 gnl/TRDRNA2_/TRDRNA2_80743_c1~~gnl/TRDRNA2_/TRDRNA2_80743_c1_seq1.p1  ORF type:complete len:380 (-),score=102.73 gnl/TRDRNA2_/TRDRNA2_80743_c1_seq1:161-1150(-)
MADPFGEDAVDFPIQSFINQTFDRAVTLLESFLDPDVRERTFKAAAVCAEFEVDQLKRHCPMDVIYEPGGCAATDCTFAWNKMSPVQQIPQEIELVKYIRKSLTERPVRPTMRAVKQKMDYDRDMAEPPELAELTQEISRGEDLRIEITKLKHELERMREQALANNPDEEEREKKMAEAWREQNRLAMKRQGSQSQFHDPESVQEEVADEVDKKIQEAEEAVKEFKDWEKSVEQGFSSKVLQFWRRNDTPEKAAAREAAAKKKAERKEAEKLKKEKKEQKKDEDGKQKPEKSNPFGFENPLFGGKKKSLERQPTLIDLAKSRAKEKSNV